MFTCVIVDDEPLAREALRDCIQAHSEMRLLGEAGDGEAALELVRTLRPDLLFLDVEIPEMNGFEMLRALDASGVPLPVTIFVTAFDQYALQAFEAHALDYLLKPLDEKRFEKAVTAAKSRIVADQGHSSAAQLVELLSQREVFRQSSGRIAVKSKGKIVFLRLAEVEWVEAQGNYLRLHIADESFLVRDTMSSFQTKLDPLRFMRIHRSAIVNIDYVKDVQPWFTGEYVVHIQSGKELTLTRSYRDNLRRLMGESSAGAPD